MSDLSQILRDKNIPLWVVEDVEYLENQSEILIDILRAIKEENPSIRLAGPIMMAIDRLPKSIKDMLR